MRTIKAKPSELLKAIRENYEKHKKDYAEAFEGYKIEVEEEADRVRESFLSAMTKMLDKVRSAKLDKGDKPVAPTMHYMLMTVKPPVDHSRDYEVVIKMLEFEQSSEVEIDTEQFECYVMDRWDWKEEFVATHNTYSNKLSSVRR